MSKVSDAKEIWVRRIFRSPSIMEGKIANQSLRRRITMRTFDLSPLYRSTVGYDVFADLLDRLHSKEVAQTSYPPFNIEKTSEDSYRISIAAAGFSKDELELVVSENQLVVTARKSGDDDARQFLYRGIAQRAFEKKFQLAEHVVVSGAAYEDGMLHVDLRREVPEVLKPRQIKIDSSVGLDQPSNVESLVA